MDWAVMRLVSSQVQFWLIIVLIVWIMAMRAWKDHIILGGPLAPTVCVQVLYFSPLILIMFLDGIKRQSKKFRLGLPFLYMLYVGLRLYEEGYAISTQAKTPMLNVTSSTLPVMLTIQGQISGRLSTIFCLMIQFLSRAFTDAEGNHICFPVGVISLRKTDAVALNLPRNQTVVPRNHMEELHAVDMEDIMAENRELREQLVRAGIKPCRI